MKEKRIESFEDLEVYQRLCELHLEINETSLKFPKFEIYELGSQVRRSSNSVSIHLPPLTFDLSPPRGIYLPPLTFHLSPFTVVEDVEKFQEQGKEYMRYLIIARGSKRQELLT